MTSIIKIIVFVPSSLLHAWWTFQSKSSISVSNLSTICKNLVPKAGTLLLNAYVGKHGWVAGHLSAHSSVRLLDLGFGQELVLFQYHYCDWIHLGSLAVWQLFLLWWCSRVYGLPWWACITFKDSIDEKCRLWHPEVFQCVCGNQDSIAIGNEEIWNGETIFPSSVTVIDSDLVYLTFQWADKFCISVLLSFSAYWTNFVKA